MSANLRTPKKSNLSLMHTRNSSSDSKKYQCFYNEIPLQQCNKVKVFFPIKNNNSQKENIYLKNLKKTIKKELFERKSDVLIGNNKTDLSVKSEQTYNDKNENNTPKILITNDNIGDILFKENKKLGKNINQEEKIKNFNINETEITKRDGKYFLNNHAVEILETFKDNFLFNEKYFKLLIEFMDLEDLCKFHKVCKKFFFSKFKSIIKKRLCELIRKVFILFCLNNFISFFYSVMISKK